MKKNERGITLIALIITIIILVILAAVSIHAVANMGIVGRAVNGAQDYAKAAVEENRMYSNVESVIEQGLLGLNPFNEEKGVNAPKTITGMIPIKWNGSNWVVCDIKDKDWYDYASAEEITEDNTRSMSWANIMLSDGKYKADTVKVGQVVQDSELGSMFVWIPRYAYCMTKYKSAVDGATDGNNGKTQNITKVAFLKGTSNEDVKGYRYARDYNADEQTVGEESEMIVHPAFNFGGKDLTGIWVAKFEASMAETNANTTAENNNKALEKTLKVLPNAESWRYINVGNCFNVCYNMRNNSVYGISSSTNTHLLKNSEWGAVAYLAASQYGKIPARNTNGASYTENDTTKYHAYTAGESTEGGYKTAVAQSTTGTVNGIYDMNGGAWEYVAVYFDNGSGNLGNGGSALFPANGGYKLNSEYTAYWDKYEVSGDDGKDGFAAKTTDGNKLVAKAAYDRVQLMKSHKGDAIYETINTFAYYAWYSVASTSGSTNYEAFKRNGWFRATYDSNGNVTANNDTSELAGRSYYDDDAVYIGTSVLPFLKRGGSWNIGSSAGVFCTIGNIGSTSFSIGFRPALAF